MQLLWSMKNVIKFEKAFLEILIKRNVRSPHDTIYLWKRDERFSLKGYFCAFVKDNYVLFMVNSDSFVMIYYLVSSAIHSLHDSARRTPSYTYTDIKTDTPHSLVFSTSNSTKHRPKTYNTKTVNKIRLVCSILIIAPVKLRIFMWIFVLLSCNFQISNHPLRASALHACILTIWSFIFGYNSAAGWEYLLVL